VEKQDGTTEPYSREKLEKGILIACGKRPVSMEKIREQLGILEDKWGKTSIIKSKKIGEDVVEMLRGIDEIAYIRFASVYKEFRDAENFRTEFEKLFK
jgi:transcriptional repressor NrdR